MKRHNIIDTIITVGVFAVGLMEGMALMTTILMPNFFHREFEEIKTLLKDKKEDSE